MSRVQVQQVGAESFDRAALFFLWVWGSYRTDQYPLLEGLGSGFRVCLSSFKGDIDRDTNVEVDVNVDSYFGFNLCSMDLCFSATATSLGLIRSARLRATLA